MSSATMTRMLVLGVVSIFEPANGYQIRRELLSWGVEQWADLKPGSVYSMLATLTQRGSLVRHDLTEGPRRVAVYEVSDAGQVEFKQLVATGLAESATMDRTLFKTALSFAPFLTREEFLDGLRGRATRVDEMRADLVSQISAHHVTQVIPPHVVHSLVLDVALMAAELEWLQGFLMLVEAGSLTFFGEPDGWQPPQGDSGWELVEQSARYRAQIAAEKTA